LILFDFVGKIGILAIDMDSEEAQAVDRNKLLIDCWRNECIIN
jgi:hypothetical protein